MKKLAPRPMTNIIVGLACAILGLLWLAFILFFAIDAVGDYREAHGAEVGPPIHWTWRDTFQQLGGAPRIFFGFVPPTILLAYGSYLCFTSIRRLLRLVPPPNDIENA
jgi:hypothetical protein